MQWIERRLLLASDSFSILSTVTGQASDPQSQRVVLDSAGDLFGTAAQGGAFDEGSIYEIASATSNLLTLVSFSSHTGANPRDLVIDSAGNLFGISDKSPDGDIFELHKGSATITLVATFDGSTANGGMPTSLVIDDNGNLFGTTQQGGADGIGTIFEIAAGSNQITTLVSFGHEFRGPTGFDTMATPPMVTAVDRFGNLYGTDNTNGPDQVGTIFELRAGSHAIKTLVTFDNTNGSFPLGVVLDRAGNLLGTANGGSDVQGSPEKGTIFELVKGTGQITTLATFDGSDEAVCDAAPIIDKAGDLFGTTEGTKYNITPDQPFNNATDEGAVFELPAASHTILTLQGFYGSNGADPLGLAVDSAQNVFGATFYSDQGVGEVFKLSPTTQVGNLKLLTLDGNGAPAPAIIELSRSGVALARYHTTSKGTQTIQNIPAGNYDLSLFATGTGVQLPLWGTSTTTISTGQTTHLTLQEQEPYISSVAIIDTQTGQKITGHTVPFATPIQVQVRVNNGTNKPLKTELNFTLNYVNDGSAPTQATEIDDFKLIPAGAVVAYSFSYTPQQPGLFTASALVGAGAQTTLIENFTHLLKESTA
jgi:uncharacterized repeat protein (TIGR03803 family)